MSHVLYVDRDGGVHSGHLTQDPSRPGTAPALLTRAGRRLGPGDVLAVLARSHPSDDQRAALWRAHQTGFRVEGA